MSVERYKCTASALKFWTVSILGGFILWAFLLGILYGPFLFLLNKPEKKQSVKQTITVEKGEFVKRFEIVCYLVYEGIDASVSCENSKESKN